MFWDDLLRRWRRDNRQLGPRLLVGAAGRVAVAPTRRAPRRRTYLALAVAILVLLGLASATGRLSAAVIPGDSAPPPAVVMLSM